MDNDIARRRMTEAHIRKQDASDLVDEYHKFEDKIDLLEAEIERLREKCEEAICEWEPEGNGYYFSDCGELYKDKGRFIAMRRKFYNSHETQIPFISECPNCKKTVYVYGERDKYKEE